MRTRWLFWDEDEVQKKKTLVLVLAILLIILLLGCYAAIIREGGLIAEVTPTTLPSPGAVTTPTLPVPTPTARSPVSATPEAKATPTAGLKPTIASPTPGALERTLTPATPLFTSTPVLLEPTITLTFVLTAPLAAPVIITPPHGGILKNDRPTIAGTAPPDTTVQLYDDGSLVGTTAANTQGDWTLIPDKPLAPGEHTVTAVASDETGRTSAPSKAVTFTIAIERLPTVGGSWFERWLDRFLAIAFP